MRNINEKKGGGGSGAPLRVMSIVESGRNHPPAVADVPVGVNILMFVTGALTTLDFSFIGRVAAAEMIMFVFLPVLFFSRKVIFWNREFWKVSAALFGMALATYLADVYNHNLLEFSARAIARPVFIYVLMLFFILVLVSYPRSLGWFAAGLIPAGIINYFRPSEFEKAGAEDVSSYGGIVFRVEPLMAALGAFLAVIIWRKSRILSVLGPLSAAITLGVLGASRSSLLSWLLASAILAGVAVLGRSGRIALGINRSRLWLLGLGITFTLALVYVAYIQLAPQGALGDEHRMKFEQQRNTVLGVNPVGFILGGRPQVFGALLGIMDRPILGFGSWRHDLTGPYVFEAMSYVGTDPKVLDLMSKTGAIQGAGHSVLFQAWVENGIVPAFAWMFIMYVCFRVMWVTIKYSTIYTPLFVVWGSILAWIFLFSPPPVGLRYMTGILLAFNVVFMDKRKPLRTLYEIGVR
jgi:hypothetical protein